MKSFNREKFLLFMLAGIFIWQAAVFTYGVVGCFQSGSKAACPDLGDRYENTVNVMVATTLALLGAGAVVGVTQRKDSSSDDLDEPSSLPAQAPPARQEPQGRGKARG